jgi:P27 family predicted phage terminase small subunit
MSKTPPAPAGLSKDASAVWKRLHATYELGDEGAQQILSAGLRAFDTMRSAEAIIARDGVVVLDRYSTPKAHPACDIATRARGQWLGALRMLGLNREVPE